MNDTDKNNSEREESDLALEKESATFTSQKQHLEELSDAKETFIGGPEVEAKSNSTKDSDNPIAKVGSSVASDKMRDGCNANAIPCPATSNHTTEPSSVASQEASPASTKDTAIPEQVERPSSEELLADVSLPQGKVEPKKTEPAPAASSNIQQHGCKQAGNGNTEPKSKENTTADDDPITRLQRAAGTAICHLTWFYLLVMRQAALVQMSFCINKRYGFR
ncbi:hypothetical protein ZEAMMB73_Zm00001d051092 [Zea mays]|uniref:Uncharacterized protein n=1 Tax=Zea mays TaxID=4577 RepID=A0A1D6Q4X7_MAIZE|nr:hypothetical protein ZEAMMB73_Zm00001d051092 [Zea mays]